MPSIAQAALDPICGKKRRRQEEEEIGVSMKVSSPHLNRHNPLPDTTQIFNGQIRDDTIGNKEGFERRHILPKPLRLHESSKRQRIERPISSPYPQNYANDVYFARDVLDDARRIHPHPPTEGTGVEGSKEARVAGKIDLSPCYICHRKPTARHELDAFADCEGCGNRTCWICIRECLGFGVMGIERLTPGFEITREEEKERDPFAFSFEGGAKDKQEGGEREEVGRNWERERIGGHRGMVCSRCCVERGTEGEVWCLGCLRAEGDG